jgi:hypothetical protein
MKGGKMDMAEFASKGVAGSGLGLGIAGTALGVLNGGLGNILGGLTNNCGCGNSQYVNRYEMELENKIVNRDTEIALLKSNIYTDQKIADVYERLNTKISGVEAGLSAQAVYNATNTATINCIQGQVAQLFGLTKLVVPNNSVCPGWGNVTITPASTTVSV